MRQASEFADASDQAYQSAMQKLQASKESQQLAQSLSAEHRAAKMDLERVSSIQERSGRAYARSSAGS